jgi:hypothetical protein
VDGGDGGAAAARLLASGGDDGRLLLWDWRAALSGGDAAPLSPAWRDAVAAGAGEDGAGRVVAVADIAHGRKVQAVAAGPGGLLAVCDVGATVAVVEVGGL